MATDTERFEMLSLIVELILKEGEGVSPEDLLRAQKFHEAASAGYNMFKLRGRELVDCAMNAVRFDEVGPAKSMELVQQMIDERTDTERLNLLESVVVDMEYMRRASRFRGEASVLGVEIHIAGHSQSKKAWGENLRVCLDALSGKFDDEPEA